MSNIENQRVEVPEIQETKLTEQGSDMNDRVDATCQETSDDWDGEIEDLPDEPFNPAGNEATISYAHENVSRTELANAPDVRSDFNNAAQVPEASVRETEKTDNSEHDLNPPPSPDF